MASSSVWEFTPSSLPDDVVLLIAAFLNASDVCSLGTCSRYLRDVSSSDSLWLRLFRSRWPSAAAAAAAEEEASSTASPHQGWKKIYMRRHKKIAEDVSTVITYLEECSQNDSLEVGNYLRAVEYLSDMELEFEDVKLFLFNAKNSVMLNLVGLHYSMFKLCIRAEYVNTALHSCQVSSREICVFSFRLGRWFFGFRLPDERISRKVSLSELTSSKEEMLRSMLNRGAVHEVLRVQITALTSPAATRVCTLPDPRGIS